MSNGIIGPYSNLPVVLAQRADEAATEGTPPETTVENAAIAKDFPAGTVSLERSGLKLGLQIPGGALALGGAALLGISLLSRRAPGAAESRLLAAPLVLGGSMVGLGAATAIGAELLPPKQVVAAATNIPTRARAQEIANTFTERRTEVVQDTSGKFAVLDKGPLVSRSPSGGVSYGGGYGHYHSGHYHDHYHYSGDHHYHQGGYSGPWYPDHSNNYPDPYYPTPGSYPTSPGDDFGYDWDPYYPPSNSGGTSGGDDYDYSPSYPSNPGSGTSGGDDYSPPSYDYDPPSYDPPSYDPPSYDPPSYDPPSYDPPSYDPPSYDPPSYDPPSYDSGGYGDSSSNGNPSYDDF